MQKPVFLVVCERIGRRDAYKVSFPYHPEVVERVRNLPQEKRKWNDKDKSWEISTGGLFAVIKSYKRSKKIYFDFGDDKGKKTFVQLVEKHKKREEEHKFLLAELEKKKEYWTKWKEELEENYLKYWDQLHQHLKEGVKLYPHQVVAAMFLNEAKSALISHEMGLGKTLVSIGYVEMNGFEKVFVITPNSLKFNYYYEVEKFTDSKAHIINWRKNKYSIEEAKYVIVNYEFFNKNNNDKGMDKKWKKLGIEKIDVLVCDESHRLKNTKTNTYKNFDRIFKKRMFNDGKVSKVFLTGTPAPNRAYELYTVLHQISPLDFKTKTDFYKDFCGMTYDHDGGWGYVESGEKHLEELYKKIAPYTHRKRKFEVLKDLPDKIYQRIILEMTDSEYAEYFVIEEGVVDEITLKPTLSPITIMLRLRQFTSNLKVKYMKELVDNVMDTGEKIVIVDIFKDSLLELYEMFGNIAGLHTGDQTVEERAEVVKKFQDPNSDMKIFIGSIQTCNYGLTLTAADKLFIMTLPFSVGEYDQVSDRLHRIGQKNVVNIYPLIFPDTVDDYVFSSIENKRAEIVKVIDNEDYKSDVEESVLTDVIRKIKVKHRENKNG
jgi:SWI/SNF-related matrix-associated actin-dependent regulator 1 of chromatin subfamily A